jgi:GAF domain-containing protein/HAMP domain-containing protein
MKKVEQQSEMRIPHSTFPWGLRTKIIAWSFVPTVIILVAVALATFIAYQRVTEELVIERDQDLTRLSAGQLATELAEYTDLLTALARTADIYRSDPAAQRDALLGASNRLAVFDAGVLILDTFGIVVATGLERPEAWGQDWSHRDCYRELLRSSMLGSPGPVFSNIMAAGPQDVEVVCIAVPITGERGELMGAMVGMFRLGATAVSAFYGDIVKLRIGEGGSTYLVDGNGRVIYHSDTSRIGEDFSAQEVVQQVLSGQVDAIRTRDAKGLDIVASFAPVPGTPWGLVIEESWATLTSGSRGYQQFLLLLLVLGVAVPILVVFVGVRQITRPITELISAAREVARGNFGRTITARTGDEVEELAKQFNLMSAQLQESYAHLERRVADRTKELAALNAIAATVSRSLDLDKILDDAVEKTLQVMEIEAGGIYLLDVREPPLAPPATLALPGHGRGAGESNDEEAGVLTVAAQRGFSPQFVADVDRLKVGEGFSGRVAQSGEPLVVRDVSADPRLTRKVVREEGLRSLAVVPLSSKGKVMGTLFAVTHGYREFTEQDVQLLISIGHQIGVAIENARFFEAEQRRAEEFRAISEVGRRITSILPVDELLAEIAHVVKETLGYYLVGIGLIEGDELVFRAGAGAVWENDKFQPPRLKVGQEGITGWVAHSGEPLLVPDVSQEPRYYSLPQASEIRSELAVPLKTKEAVIGVLHVQSDQLNAFDQRGLTVLQSLAHQAAIAIENARLFEAEHRRRQEATLLAEMTKLISSTLDLDEVLRLTAEYAVDVFDVHCCCILLWDERKGTLRPAAQIGFDDPAAAAITEVEFTPSETMRRTVFEDLRALTIEDVPSDPHLSPQDLLDLQSALVVPIEVGGQRLGAMQLGTHGPTRRRFTADEGELALAMANQAAMAIENAHLFDAEQRRAEEFRVISEVGRRVTSILAVDEILEQIARLVKDTLGYHQVAIGLVEGDEVVFRTAAGFFWEALESQPLHLKVGQEGITGWVVQSGEPLLVPDVSRDPRYYRVPGDSKTKSELVVPLKTKDAVIGVLAVSSDRLDGFDETDLAVLQSLAHQATLAIENARLFEAEQWRAEQFRVISEVGRRITSILAVDELLRQMTRLLKEAFNYHGVGIGLIEEDELVFKAGAGSFWDDPQFQPLSLKVGQEGLTGWVADTGEPLLVPDVSQEPRYYLPPLPQAQKTRSELAVPMKAKGKVIGVLDVESDHLDAFDESDLVMLQSLANQAAIAIENARLFDAEQRRAEQFWVISAVGRRITSILDIDEVLVQLVRLIQRAFDYDHVGIALIEGDEAVYKVGAGELWEDSQFQFRPARLKVGQEGITGWVAATGEPLLVPDVSQDPRYVWMRDSKTRSELAVPIKTKGEVIGVLDVQSKRLDAFDESDLVVLQSLANQAAIAIENARLYEQAQQLAVMEERNRLARDLHDAVTQTLFSASLIAEALPAIWEGDQAEGRQLLKELRQLSRGALAEMRTLLLELRPAALAEARLGDLLRQLAEAVVGRTGLPVTVTVEGQCMPPPDVHVTLYRIAQEALNNVVKHASASQVAVSLRCTSSPSDIGGEGQERIELQVSDDGRGFGPDDVPPDRLGLGIIRERAQAVGATLEIESQPGRGTQVVVVWEPGE